MPTVNSKLCGITHFIHLQDEVIHDQLVHYKDAMRMMKNFNNYSCKRYSFELLKLQQNFYENLRLVLSAEKAKCLAAFFWKGTYPQRQELRILCEYYKAMSSRI